MSTVKKNTSNVLVKPLMAALSAAVLDRFVMKNENMNSNLYFAAAVGSGVFLAASAGAILDKQMPTSTPMGRLNKTLEGRVIEVTLGTAGVYALNRFVLNNEYNLNTWAWKIGIIVASDLIGETAAEMIIHM